MNCWSPRRLELAQLILAKDNIQLASLIPGAPLTEANQFDPVAQTTELSAEQSV
ncbi:MAG: hypothetical protein H0T92_25405, partial [Pyrinomonadaceae bacterium]|nr:hypothetical protein [Pyrinomonadaceae bacterium]